MRCDECKKEITEEFYCEGCDLHFCSKECILQHNKEFEEIFSKKESK